MTIPEVSGSSFSFLPLDEDVSLLARPYRVISVLYRSYLGTAPMCTVHARLRRITIAKEITITAPAINRPAINKGLPSFDPGVDARLGKSTV